MRTHNFFCSVRSSSSVIIVIMLMLICRSCRLWAVSAGSEAGKQGRPTWPRRDERRLILRTSTPKPAKVVVLRRRFEGESARLSRVLGRGDPTTRQPTARHRPEHGHLPAVFCCRAIHLKPASEPSCSSSCDVVRSNSHGRGGGREGAGRGRVER